MLVDGKEPVRPALRSSSFLTTDNITTNNITTENMAGNLKRATEGNAALKLPSLSWHTYVTWFGTPSEQDTPLQLSTQGSVDSVHPIAAVQDVLPPVLVNRSRRAAFSPAVTAGVVHTGTAQSVQRGTVQLTSMQL